LVLTIPLPVLRIIARLCLQKYDEFITLQSSREQQGNIGNFKEKDNAFYQQPFAHSFPVFFFYRPFDAKIGRCMSYSIILLLSGTL